LTEAFLLVSNGNIFINRNKKEEEVMKNSKLSTLISLTLALLLAFSLVTGCATSQSGKTDEANAVRVPPGDPTEFWDEQGWEDMSKAEQALWGVLGWTEEAWNEEAKPPASEDKYWNQLSDEERAACEKLSYTKESWDK
jgi:hypothetical protein